MIPKINQRILQIIQKTGLTNNGFAESIGTSSAVMSHISTGRNKPNVDLILKLIKKYTNVSLEWLLLGEGEMLIDRSASPEDLPQRNITEGVTESTEEINLLNEVITSQRNAIESLERTLKAHGKLVDYLREKRNNSPEK